MPFSSTSETKRVLRAPSPPRVVACYRGRVHCCSPRATARRSESQLPFTGTVGSVVGRSPVRGWSNVYVRDCQVLIRIYSGNSIVAAR